MGSLINRLLCFLFDHSMRFTVDRRFYCTRCGFDMSEQYRQDVQEYIDRLWPPTLMETPL